MVWGLLVSLRLARLDDAEGITGVHCSDVDRWFRFVNGRRLEARYEELTVRERFRHGGPWMSVETCAIHLNRLLLAGQYPIVATYGGEIVGELELYIGEERGVLGKTAYIDVLEVHKRYRGRGIGRSLVSEARKIAVGNGCETVSVWPDKNAIPFYRKCGLDRVAYRISRILIKVNDLHRRPEDVGKFPWSYQIVKGLSLISPRIYSSLAAWLKSRWHYAFELGEAGFVEGSMSHPAMAFMIEGVDEGGVGRVFLWLEDPSMIDEAASNLCGIAREMGLKYLELLVEESVASELILKGFSGRIVGEEVVLMERLGVNSRRPIDIGRRA